MSGGAWQRPPENFLEGLPMPSSAAAPDRSRGFRPTGASHPNHPCCHPAAHIPAPGTHAPANGCGARPISAPCLSFAYDQQGAPYQCVTPYCTAGCHSAHPYPSHPPQQPSHQPHTSGACVSGHFSCCAAQPCACVSASATQQVAPSAFSACSAANVVYYPSAASPACAASASGVGATAAYAAANALLAPANVQKCGLGAYANHQSSACSMHVAYAHAQGSSPNLGHAPSVCPDPLNNPAQPTAIASALGARGAVVSNAIDPRCGGPQPGVLPPSAVQQLRSAPAHPVLAAQARRTAPAVVPANAAAQSAVWAPHPAAAARVVAASCTQSGSVVTTRAAAAAPSRRGGPPAPTGAAPRVVIATKSPPPVSAAREPPAASPSAPSPAPAMTVQRPAPAPATATAAPSPRSAAASGAGGKPARRNSTSRRAGAADAPKRAARLSAAAAALEDGAADADPAAGLLELLTAVADGEPLSKATLQEISLEAGALPKQRILELPTALVLALLHALHPLLKLVPANTHGVESVREELQRRLEASSEEEIELRLLAATCVLDFITVRGMPREVLIVEVVDDLVELCRAHAQQMQPTRGAAPVPAATKVQKRQRGGQASPREQGGASSPRVGGATQAPHVVKLVVVLIERLPALIETHSLDDSTILQLASLCLNLTFNAANMSLQSAAMSTVVVIFVECEAHRSVFLNDMIDAKLQAGDAQSRESRRGFPLADGARVGYFTALSMLLLQRSAALPSDSALLTGAKAPDSKAGAAVQHPFKAATSVCASQLVQALASRSLDRADDPEAKSLLEEFVHDELVLLGRPEWPSATLCLSMLCHILCRRLAPRAREARPLPDTKDMPSRLWATDLLGQVLAALARECKLHREQPLTFPPSREDVDEDAQPTDAGEDASCYCGRGHNGEFMLDCDKCHRWFHGACVGILPFEEQDVPEEWFCDSCHLSSAVAEQRQRITRLLSLHADAGASAAADGEAQRTFELLTSETEVTKQLLLNFLHTQSSDAAASGALRYWLSEWHSIAQEAQRNFLCEVYREQLDEALKCVDSQRLPPSRLPLLSRNGMASACRKLLTTSILASRFETYLNYLLLLMREPQPSARAKAIKAISAVVRVDPDTLELDAVKQAVTVALNEPSIAVREATLDLLGQFIISRPAFVERYYETIAKRLSDVGISVRKRVIKILRELCLKDPSSEKSIDACCRMIQRISDEEEVQKLVLRTFQDLWFAAPSGDDGEVGAEAIRGRCSQFVAVVQGASKSSQRSEWLQTLLTSLLTAPSDGKGQKEYAGVLRVCEQLVQQLMENLLQIDANREDDALLGPTLHSLSLFCCARPQLVLPHVELLPNYLQYDHCSAAVSHVCEMLPKLLELLDHPPSSLLEKLECFLGALVFRVPESLLQLSICALCTTVTYSRNAQLLHETLARLCHMMTRGQDPDQAERLRHQVYRSILCAGLLCRYFDFEAPGNAVETVSLDGERVMCAGDVTARVFEQLKTFANGLVSGSAVSPATPYALKAVGHLCVRRHDLLRRCNKVIGAALRTAAPPQLKQQALALFVELLRSEEQRAKAAAHAKKSGMVSKASKDASVVGDTSAAIGAALQQHQAALLASTMDGRSAAVRREALVLLKAILEQGLVHPQACIPKIMALELDCGERGCSELAKGTLRSLFGRYQQMVSAPGNVIEGITAAYNLQQSLMTSAQQPTTDAPPRPRYVYTLLSSTRKERIGYLKAVLSQLHVERLDRNDESGWPQTVARARWVAETLADLPCEKEEDPLTLVYHANRELSLHTDEVLQRLAAQLADVDANNESLRRTAPELLETAASAPVSSAHDGYAAELLCLLHLLKRHLKRLYQLSDFKCQTFDVADNTAGQRPVARLSDTLRLDVRPLSRLPPSAAAGDSSRTGSVGAGKGRKENRSSGSGAPSASANSTHAPTVPSTPEEAASSEQRLVVQYLWLRELVAADEMETDFNLFSAAANKAATPRGGNRDGGSTAPRKKRAGNSPRTSKASVSTKGKAAAGSAPAPRKRRKSKLAIPDHDDELAEESDRSDDADYHE